MFKSSRVLLYTVLFVSGTLLFAAYNAFAAKAGQPAPAPDGFIERSRTLFDLLLSGGLSMLFLFILSILALASIIYHFRTVVPAKLIPKDFI